MPIMNSIASLVLGYLFSRSLSMSLGINLIPISISPKISPFWIGWKGSTGFMNLKITAHIET